jgi:hypothetical protein
MISARVIGVDDFHRFGCAMRCDSRFSPIAEFTHPISKRCTREEETPGAMVFVNLKAAGNWPRVKKYEKTNEMINLFSKKVELHCVRTSMNQ